MLQHTFFIFFSPNDLIYQHRKMMPDPSDLWPECYWLLFANLGFAFFPNNHVRKCIFPFCKGDLFELFWAVNTLSVCLHPLSVFCSGPQWLTTVWGIMLKRIVKIRAGTWLEKTSHPWFTRPVLCMRACICVCMCVIHKFPENEVMLFVSVYVCEWCVFISIYLAKLQSIL